MNNTKISGNLTSDIKLEKGTGQDGRTWTRGRVQIAVDNGTNSKGERDVMYLPLLLWNGVAENMARLCQKGSRVLVDCKIDFRTPKKDDGTYATYFNLIVNSFEVMNRSTNNMQAQSASPQVATQQSAPVAVAPQPQPVQVTPVQQVAPVPQPAPAPIMPAAEVPNVYNGPGYEAPSVEQPAFQPMDPPQYW